jgi:hypothetical protein
VERTSLTQIAIVIRSLTCFRPVIESSFSFDQRDDHPGSGSNTACKTLIQGRACRRQEDLRSVHGRPIDAMVENRSTSSRGKIETPSRICGDGAVVVVVVACYR